MYPMRAEYEVLVILKLLLRGTEGGVFHYSPAVFEREPKATASGGGIFNDQWQAINRLPKESMLAKRLSWLLMTTPYTGG